MSLILRAVVLVRRVTEAAELSDLVADESGTYRCRSSHSPRRDVSMVSPEAVMKAAMTCNIEYEWRGTRFLKDTIVDLHQFQQYLHLAEDTYSRWDS